MKKSFFNKFPAGVFLCAFTVFLFFLPNLLTGKIPIPADSLIGLYHPFRDISLNGYNPGKFPVKNPLITDPVLQTYPWRSQVIKSIQNGQMPFWNPYSLSGQPLLANVQSSAFSIFNILFFILPFNIAWGVQIIASSILAAVFMFLFLRNLKLEVVSAAFGSIVLAFSGFFIAWLEWGTIITTALWLPLILFSFDKLRGKRSGLWFLLLIFSLVQALVAGHLQTALYVVLAFAAYALYSNIVNKKLVSFLLALCALLAAVTIASPQLLPSWEFIQNSARGSDQGYYQGRQDWFVPAQNLIQVVIPDYFGNPATYNYWGVWNYAEFVSFIGVIPFFFVLLYLLTKKRQATFFILLFIVGLVFALQNFVSKLPYTLNVPFVSSLQPSRIIFLIDFSFCVLAAYGFNNLWQAKDKQRKVLIAALLTLLLILATVATTFLFGRNFEVVNNLDPQNIALKNSLLPLMFAGGLVMLLIASQILKQKRKAILLLLFLLTVIELFRFGYKFTPFSKYEWIFPQTNIIAFLVSQHKPFRIMTTDRRILHPNISSYYQIESVDGYDPLYLKKYGQFVASWQDGRYQDQVPSFNRIVTPQKLDSPVINLLNVDYVLSFDEIKQSGFVKVMEEGDTKLYRNTNALARIFFVEEIVKTNNTDAFSQIVKNSSQLKTKSYSPDFSFKSDQEGTAQARISAYTPNQIVIDTVATTERPLVIGNVNDAGWTATIDSKKVSIYPSNVLFQSIIVPQGNHKVKLNYQPAVFKQSLLISFFGLVVGISVSLLLWRKKYQ